jgi:hypothetical protein
MSSYSATAPSNSRPGNGASHVVHWVSTHVHACQAECARRSGPVQHPQTRLGSELRFSFNQNVLIFILQSNSYTHICEKNYIQVLRGRNSSNIDRSRCFVIAEPGCAPLGQTIRPSQCRIVYFSFRSTPTKVNDLDISSTILNEKVCLSKISQYETSGM